MTLHFKDIILCDDHSICRIGVAATLRGFYSEDLQIRNAAYGNEVLQLSKEKFPDLYILDLGLPDMPGLELIKAVRSMQKEAKILVLTNCDNLATLQQVLLYKVDGILHKTCSIENILEALQTLQIGETYVAPSIERMMKDNESAALTKREYEVLEFIIKGSTNKEIAEFFKCSAETIKSHRANLMKKVDARNTAELIAWYLERNDKVGAGPLT